MIKPRRLPRIGGGTNPQNQNANLPVPNDLFQRKRKNPEEDLPINKNTDPDFIRKYRKIRNRHQQDFAISLVPNTEDIISEDARLYDNKDINLEVPKIKENIDLDNTEFYIESIHHDQYYKINQIKKEEKNKEEILGEGGKVVSKKRRKTQHKLFTALEQAQALENKLYNKFDRELTDVITKTLAKVTIIFLFAQGLLAGMGLLHVILFLTYDKYDDLDLLSKMIIILYDIFHALTFTSLVGNGIKFVSSYQKYNIMNLQIHGNNNEFMRLRRDMIFSGILLVFFTVVFGFEVYLATFVQKINLDKCYEGEDKNIYIDEDEFNNFKYCHIVLDIVVIILFILNVFDLNIREVSTEQTNNPINVNFYLGSENNNENDITQS